MAGVLVSAGGGSAAYLELPLSLHQRSPNSSSAQTGQQTAGWVSGALNDKAASPHVWPVRRTPPLQGACPASTSDAAHEAAGGIPAELRQSVSSAIPSPPGRDPGRPAEPQYADFASGASMDPQAASILRRPAAVLNALPGAEDRRGPWPPDGQHRLPSPADREGTCRRALRLARVMRAAR
jgi:hypothetical protein